METLINEDFSKEQLNGDRDDMETGKPAQTVTKSRTGKRKLRTRKATTDADLVRAFEVANIPLMALNIRGLVQYLQDNVSDPAAPSSRDQLKSYYRKYMRLNKSKDSPSVCSVQGCRTWSQEDHKCTIFSFPDCKVTVKLWKQALNLSNHHKMQGVCELHFDEAFLIRECEKNSVTLMPGAIPKNVTGSIYSANHCRMCGLVMKCPMTNTVSKMHTNHRLRPVLEMCLELNDSQHSLLPDKVCDECTKTVQSVSKFAEVCWDAQHQLLDLYAGGIGKKVQPWKRLYQYSDDTEDTNDDSSDHALSEQMDGFTAEEQVIEIEAKYLPIEYHCDNDISINAETSDKCNSIDDENLPNSTDQKTARQKFKFRGQMLDNVHSHKKYECSTCWQRFPSQAELTMHTQKHNRERNEGKSTADAVLTGWSIDTIKCLQCKHAFKTAEELKAHTAKEHNHEVYCPACGLRVRNNYFLDQHRKRARRCFVHDAGSDS